MNDTLTNPVRLAISTFLDGDIAGPDDGPGHEDRRDPGLVRRFEDRDVPDRRYRVGRSGGIPA